MIRDESGMNRFHPKFSLRLSSQNQLVMMAEKLLKTTTKHYKIKIAFDGDRYVRMKESVYLGRLRGNITSTQFYLYDDGLNPKDDKVKIIQGGRARNQFGTVIYSDKDKFGKKVPRNMDVFIPMIDHKGDFITSWPDTDARKGDILMEYTNQQKLETGANYRLSTTLDMTPISYFRSRAEYLDYQGRAHYQSKKNF